MVMGLDRSIFTYTSLNLMFVCTQGILIKVRADKMRLSKALSIHLVLPVLQLLPERTDLG